MSLATECFSMNSVMSRRISGSLESNSSVASTLTSSVFPTPVGPTKMNDAGRRRGLSCTRVRLIAFASRSTASSCPMIFSFR